MEIMQIPVGKLTMADRVWQEGHSKSAQPESIRRLLSGEVLLKVDGQSIVLDGNVLVERNSCKQALHVTVLDEVWHYDQPDFEPVDWLRRSADGAFIEIKSPSGIHRYRPTTGVRCYVS